MGSAALGFLVDAKVSDLFTRMQNQLKKRTRCLPTSVKTQNQNRKKKKSSADARAAPRRHRPRAPSPPPRTAPVAASPHRRHPPPLLVSRHTAAAARAAPVAASRRRRHPRRSPPRASAHSRRPASPCCYCLPPHTSPIYCSHCCSQGQINPSVFYRFISAGSGITSSAFMA